MRILSVLVIVLALFVLTACEQDATPFPIEIPPTETPTPPESSLPPVRYGIAENASAIIPNLGTNTEVVIISGTIDPNRLNSEFDILLTFGDVDGWTPSPTLTVGLIQLPLTPPELNNIVTNAIAPQQIVDMLTISGGTALYSPSRTPIELRDELANMGRPDGFSLSIGYINVPGAEAIPDQLSQINIDNRAESMSLDAIRDSLRTNALQIGIVVWSDESERNSWIEDFPDATILDLYTLPLSYVVVPDYTINSGALGFPVINR